VPRYFGLRRSDTGEIVYYVVPGFVLFVRYSGDGIKSIMRLAGNVVRAKEKNPHRAMVGKPGGKRPLVRPRHRWESSAMLLKYDGRFIWLGAWASDGRLITWL
jgi:hypothetical protein